MSKLLLKFAFSFKIGVFILVPSVLAAGCLARSNACMVLEMRVPLAWSCWETPEPAAESLAPSRQGTRPTHILPKPAAAERGCGDLCSFGERGCGAWAVPHGS